jgi:hypothetical protein
MWRANWNAIVGNIDGLIESTKTLFLFDRPDPYSTVKRSLLPHAISIFQEIEGFRNDFKGILPKKVEDEFDKFLSSASTYAIIDGSHDVDKLMTLTTRIKSLQTIVDYHLKDTQRTIKRRTERAFEHLQRSIVADKTERRKWQIAFGNTKTAELECEKLGAVHLLLHGIWAFKTDAEGERTDLVFDEPITDLAQVERTSNGLVLTEWKVVKNQTDASQKSKQALRQAKLYSQGILGGLELRSTRYLVLVSKDRLDKLPDIHEGDLTYRYINIAVEPKTPSQSRAKT